MEEAAGDKAWSFINCVRVSRNGLAASGRLSGDSQSSDANRSQGFPQGVSGDWFECLVPHESGSKVAKPKWLEGDSNPSDANESQGFPQELSGVTFEWLNPCQPSPSSL